MPKSRNTGYPSIHLHRLLDLNRHRREEPLTNHKPSTLQYFGFGRKEFRQTSGNSNFLTVPYDSSGYLSCGRGRHQTSSALPAEAQYIRRVFDIDESPQIKNEMGLLADKDNKTLAANNTSLLIFTEFIPVSSSFPTGEIEVIGGAMGFGARVPIPPREELPVSTTERALRSSHRTD